MDEMNVPQETFGCTSCWPAAAEAAWQARSSLRVDSKLVDESHFQVTICSCQSCSQRFVLVFTETIDWVDGEDPQYWTLLPISEGEAAKLSHGDKGIEALLNTLAPQRRSLCRDFPKGGSPNADWSYGISVGLHD